MDWLAVKLHSTEAEGTLKKSSSMLSLVEKDLCCEKIKRTSSASNIITSNSTCGQKYNLISEGSLSCLYPNPSSNQSTNLLNRLLHQSKISYSWETHTIVLEESQIVTKTTPKGMFTSGIPFSSILKVTTFKMPKAPKCTKVFTKDGNFLLQAPSVHLQDQWFYSLQWKVTVNKYKDILMEAKSDVLLQELKLLVSLAMSFPLHVADTHIPVLNIVSQLLSKKAVTMSNLSQEELITALAPLVENNQPSQEICSFFIKHCRYAPRSLIVLDTFTPIVHRILTQSANFGKKTFLRTFIIEYIQALNCQNNAEEAFRKFLKSVHGPMSHCPHPRILHNLVSVCLSAIYRCFASEIENKRNKKDTKCQKEGTLPPKIRAVATLNNLGANAGKNFKKNNKDVNLKSGNLAENKPLNINMQSRDLNLKETHDQHKKRATRFSDDKPTTSEYDIASMKLFVLILDQIFQIEDWGPGVAGLLQPLPFPEEALRNREFIRSMYPLIERITHDPRDVVVQTLLHLRDGKDGWLQIYSLNSTLCEDDGRLFLSMVTELSQPGVQSGKRKKFLSMLLSSQLQAIITLAVRGSEIMIQLLSEFLELDIVSDKQSQLQIFSAMRCTASGRKVYEELCSRREVNEQMTGPTEFRMSPNSTFHDLEVLLGSGSWGNLERLDLSFMQATQAIVPTISKLRNLKHLDLRFTDFNDEGLKNLCDSNLNLETLNLCETQVTDDGIQHLGVMTKLKYLNLNSTGITAQVFTNLKESLSPDAHYDVTYTDAW